MKCPFCNDCALHEPDLERVPVTVEHMIYPEQTKVIVGNRIDIGRLLSNFEMTSGVDGELPTLRVELYTRSHDPVKALKLDGSTKYEMTIDLSQIKEIG